MKWPDRTFPWEFIPFVVLILFGIGFIIYVTVAY